MQSNDMEFEFSPSILNTPSLMTPSILPNSTSYKPSYNGTHTDYSSTAHDSSSTADSSSLATTVTTSAANSEPSTSSISSADAKVSIIEDVLKQSLLETRKPTPSPFEKFASGTKMSFPPTSEDAGVTEIPSTADVVLALESLTNQSVGKYLTKSFPNESTEREATANSGDTNRYDVQSTLSTAATASPKKFFLLRSQSITDGTSTAPMNNYPNVNLSQKASADNGPSNAKNSLEDESSNDDSLHEQFSRGSQELVFVNHSTETTNSHIQQHKSAMDNGNDSNGLQPSTSKQPSGMASNKRTYHQAIAAHATPLSKANTVIIPQQAIADEVSSTAQSSGTKRQKIVSIPANTTLVNFRSATAAPSSSAALTVIPADLSPNESGGSDDQRKKQIRDSNREAARRCRERRRQYIEQLEGNLEQAKTQIKQLNEKLARVERENIQLRTLISESNIGGHSSSRLSSNESIVDYVNVVTATGIDLQSDSNHQTDGGIIQRNYISRNNL